MVECRSRVGEGWIRGWDQSSQERIGLMNSPMDSKRGFILFSEEGMTVIIAGVGQDHLLPFP